MQEEQTRVFPAQYESLAEIDRFVADGAERAGFDSSTTYQVRLAVDEACSNIIDHAYGGEGHGVIECSRHVRRGNLTIILRDFGRPFDPRSVPEPDLEGDLEERTAGGLGLYFIRHLMDEVRFDFETEDGNVLTLVKRKESTS